MGGRFGVGRRAGEGQLTDSQENGLENNMVSASLFHIHTELDDCSLSGRGKKSIMQLKKCVRE